MLESHSQPARIENLSSSQKRALAWAILDLQGKRPGIAEETAKSFFLPFAEMGLSFPQMTSMVAKLPEDWSLDHREVYYDFRLSTWLRVPEIPTLDECMEDYLKHSGSEDEAMNWMESRIHAFFQKHGRNLAASEHVTPRRKTA